MIDPRLSSLLLIVSAPSAADERRVGARPAPPPMGSLIIQQRVIIRVPRLPVGRTTMAASAAPLPPIRWVEKRGQKCVAAQTLAGAAITRVDSVDLVLNGGKRLRARLGDNCPALDFYSGFYVKPAGDGMVCADRDSIRARSGAVCRIRSFKALVPGR